MPIKLIEFTACLAFVVAMFWLVLPNDTESWLRQTRDGIAPVLSAVAHGIEHALPG